MSRATAVLIGVAIGLVLIWGLVVGVFVLVSGTHEPATPPVPVSSQVDRSTPVASPTGTASRSGTTPAPTVSPGHQPPVFTTATASSIRHSWQDITYTPDLVLDGRLDTAWVEGVDGPGVGESIILTAGTPQTVSGVTIFNAYLKSQAVYDSNNAVKDVRIIFSDGTSVYHTLTYGLNLDGERIPLSQPIETTSIQVVIVSCYLGTDPADTAITEIRVD